jgi:hypothetical protein
MTRFNAFSIHFFVSVLLVGSFLTFAYLVWYGKIFLDISGVMVPAKILVGIDVVLGPLLTLLVFKPEKKHLKLDLILIGALQLCAFIYGAYTLYLGKPALVVLNGDTFEIITQKNIQADLNQSLSTQLGILASPKYAAIKPSKTIKQQTASEQQAFYIAINLQESWVLSEQVGADVVSRQLNLSIQQLEQIVAENNWSGHSYYLLRDTFLNAVLVVKNGVPEKIIHTTKF